VAVIDRLLIGAIVVMFVTIEFLPRFSPTWWGRCLWLLDVRVWPPSKCVGVVVALVALLLIRFWPERPQQQPEETQDH
jgi:hypothetical protein